uniref:Unannotated protein n=1 Tax=freshwater metagenome TaxID=449393 RepID=A0A6J7MYZ3_9ZZZZ
MRVGHGARAAALALLTAVAAVALVAAPAPRSVVGAAHAASTPPPGSPASDIAAVPRRPRLCTAEQIAAATVRRCAVFAEGSPSDHGFATPPFPTDAIVTSPVVAEQWRKLSLGSTGPGVIVLQERLKARYPEVLVLGRFGGQTKAAVQRFQSEEELPVTGTVDAATASALGVMVRATVPSYPPKGWAWKGYSFGGSPALTEWESRLTSGTVRADPAAAPLFEGFLADLRRGSLRVDEADTYSFRCTASTTRNCKGVGSARLSYHAWGLALDLNYSTNALQTLDDPVDACGVAVEHAIPNWVLRAALHWGLFWGGWFSCRTGEQQSAVRDPHHFEFRGTPELARAIIAKNTAKRAARAAVPGITNLLLACGDRGAAVTRLRRLLPASYRPREPRLPADLFSPQLAAALARWQQDNELPVTGVLDAATARALRVKVKHSEVFPVLHLHSCGRGVDLVQRAVGVPVTGVFDSATMVALRTWQAEHGLAPTGVTDTRTAASLRLRLDDIAGAENLAVVPSDETTKPFRFRPIAASGALKRGSTRPHPRFR